MDNQNNFRRYSADYLFTMLKERKIRKGNIIILYSLETDDVDYYLVTEKDLVMYADNETCLFDNMYIMDFIKKWEFSVVFNNEEKQKIISQILSKSS